MTVEHAPSPLAPWLPPRATRVRPLPRPRAATAQQPVTVAVEVTVTGPDAMAVGADIADQLRAVTNAAETRSAAVTVSATLKRDSQAPNRTVPVQILPGQRSVLVGGLPVELTRREFDLLHFLARSPERVYSRAQLLRAVWGHEHISGERTVDVHIRRIRAKLGEYERLVKTVHGVGYGFTGRDAVVEPSS